MAAIKHKLLMLILLGTAVLAILSLAASLAQMELPPGEPFTLGGGASFKPPPVSMPAELSPALRVLLRAWLILTLALLPFSIFYLLISPNARRQFIRNLVVLGVFILIMSSLGRQLSLMQEDGLFGGLDSLALTEGGAPGQPAAFSGSAPPWLIILVSFILAAVAVALSARLIVAILHRRQRAPEPSLLRIAEEAESAMTAIAAGNDLRDTVIRCYVEMSRVVRESRGILRQQTITTREFEEQLERAGLPGDSVRDLTRLFEAVRYGAKDLGPGEEKCAMACLATIAGACRGGLRVEG